MNHYDRLRVDRDAGPSEIRAAYRRAARREHPDRHREATSEPMAAVNEAYRILGDPVRRDRYDAELDEALRGTASSDSSSGSSAAPVSRAGTAGLHDPDDQEVLSVHDPARFPWRFMLFMALAGIAFVMVGVVVYEPSPATPPDNILRSGDCVLLSLELEATEVNCGDPHDGVVQVLVSVDQPCPTGFDPYRDHQGMGTACVIRSS